MRPANEELRAVGVALAALREKRGYSQRGLAAETGIAQGTISRIEQGQSFEFDKLLVLLRTLGRKAGDLLTDAGLTDESNEYKMITVRVKVRARRINTVEASREIE